jgi:ABC-type dipeptide/oligopeptide/nickel transport system permease component
LIAQGIDSANNGDYTVGQMYYAQAYRSNWWGFIGKRVLIAVVLFFILTPIIFFSVNSGDPPTISVGPVAPVETYKSVLHYLGWDQPLLVRYFRWMGGIFMGDLGKANLQYSWLRLDTK